MCFAILDLKIQIFASIVKKIKSVVKFMKFKGKLARLSMLYKFTDYSGLIKMPGEIDMPAIEVCLEKSTELFCISNGKLQSV